MQSRNPDILLLFLILIRRFPRITQSQQILVSAFHQHGAGGAGKQLLPTVATPVHVSNLC